MKHLLTEGVALSSVGFGVIVGDAVVGETVGPDGIILGG